LNAKAIWQNNCSESEPPFEYPLLEDIVVATLKTSRHPSDAGIGLMEVIVGVLITLIVGSFLLRILSIGYEKYRLNMAITSIARELEAAREQAKERRQNVCVIFDSKEGHFGLDRNGNGKLDYNEFEELPEEAKLSEDAVVTFSRSGKLASGSKQPRIVISNTRSSRNVSVSSMGSIDID